MSHFHQADIFKLYFFTHRFTGRPIIFKVFAGKRTALGELLEIALYPNIQTMIKRQHFKIT